MCLNYCTVYMNWQKNLIKYSVGVRRLKKTTTIPLPEKIEPYRTGLVKSSQVMRFSFFMENIISPFTLQASRQPVNTDRNGRCHSKYPDFGYPYQYRYRDSYRAYCQWTDLKLFKHAFPDGRWGEISIAMQRESAILTIVFKDNGIGIPADQDWRNINALGFHLVIALVGQLDGTIELDRTGGTTFTIVVHEMKLADRTRWRGRSFFTARVT